MMVTTSFSFEAFRIADYKGLVRGIIVRSPTIPQGLVGSLKTIVGGKNRRLYGNVRTGPPTGL